MIAPQDLLAVIILAAVRDLACEKSQFAVGVIYYSAVSAYAHMNRKNEMTESTAWFKPMLDAMIKEINKTGAIKGAALEANPVWGLEDKLLISKVWSTANKSKFIWTITGESAVTDHIPGSMAATPQEAARHFSYKWQVDAERLSEMAKAESPVANSGAIIEAHAKKVIEYAESLYDLVSRDEVWK
jgi:hypothetical protein